MLALDKTPLSILVHLSLLLVCLFLLYVGVVFLKEYTPPFPLVIPFP